MITGKWRLNGDTITGYATDKQKGEALWLELLANGEAIGITQANLPEPHDCGFFFDVPPAVLEEEAELQIRVANTDIYLEEEEIEADYTASGAQSSLIGDIFLDRGLTVTGWAIDPVRTEQKLHIVAECEGKIVGEAEAAARYLRLAKADGHGFRLELDSGLADGKRHVLHLKDDKGRPLPGSPISVRSLWENAGDWLKAQKKIEKPMQEMLAEILETVELRLPGVASEVNLAHWKKTFGAPPIKAKRKAALEVWGDKSILKGQQGVDLRPEGDYVLLPGNAAGLNSHAIAHMLETLENSGADLVYADSEGGTHNFKPCFDREAFLANDYLGPCLARKNILTASGITKDSRRFDAIMAIAETGKIAHLPLLLSKDNENIETNENFEKAKRRQAIEKWLAAKYPGSTYENGNIHYKMASRPAISIIIPTRDHGEMLKTCLGSLERTNWQDYEIIIIDNGSVEDAALAILAKAEEKNNVRVLRRPGIFNYARLNNEAVALANGEMVCFLNNDTEALHAEWLSALANVLLMAGPDGGCVGAKLLWPNGLVQHGGVIVGAHQLAGHVGNHWLDDEPGYMGRNLFTQRFSAVTAACMLTWKNLFLDSGGFDARRFPIAFNDVDYCLRIGKLGKKIYWTPDSKLAHHESASRGADKEGSAKARAEREMRCFRSMWGHYADPFYNPNLSLSSSVEPFEGLALPPRDRAPRII